MIMIGLFGKATFLRFHALKGALAMYLQLKPSGQLITAILAVIFVLTMIYLLSP